MDILFVNPPSAFGAYDSTKVTVYRQVFPLLSFMCLSAYVKRHGFSTSVLDLGIAAKPYRLLAETLRRTKPRMVGITSTTPLFSEAREMAKTCRRVLGSDVTIVYGGPHVTALAEESLRDSEIDIAIKGEGETTLLEVLQGRPLPEIHGISYKEDGRVLSTPLREFIDDLDSLPLPDVSLYDINSYHCSRLVSRGWPVLHMETSRGCPQKCSFCSKGVFFRRFRTKSPERVLEEFKHFARNGAGELRITDDQFAADIGRAKEICRLILKEGISIPWNLAGGIRVDRVDQEFLDLAKRAGCYQVAIGFESGDQNSLDSIDKEITLEQSARCMEMVRRAGLESIGFFMLGLPADTEESMQRTIDFAVKMRPTYAKTTIALPLPGTRLFEQYEREGRIKTRDWSKYNFHKIADVYEHPSLSQKVLRKYYNKFYRDFYLNPRFLRERISGSLKEHTFWRDIYYAVRTFVA